MELFNGYTPVVVQKAKTLKRLGHPRTLLFPSPFLAISAMTTHPVQPSQSRPTLMDRLVVLDATAGHRASRSVSAAVVATVLREEGLPHAPSDVAILMERLSTPPSFPSLCPPSSRLERCEAWLAAHVRGVRVGLTLGVPLWLGLSLPHDQLTAPNLVNLGIIMVCMPAIARWLCTPTSARLRYP
jgi:hypothetical protein